MSPDKKAAILLPIVFLFVSSLVAFARNGPDNTFTPGPLPEGARTVIASGAATVSNNDETPARSAAISDAMRNAVEQAVGVIVSPQTAVDDYRTLSDKIYSNTSRYVSDYKLLNETVSNSIYSVKIQATVYTSRLKDDLGAIGLLMEQKKVPRAAVIILEHDIGGDLFTSSLMYAPAASGGGDTAGWPSLQHGAGPMSMAESEMAGKLADNGFDVVGPAEILKAIESSKGYKGQALDDGAAEKIGRLSNIDVILYGSADVRLYGEVPGSEMRSARAVVSLRAVDTDNGRLLFSGEQQGASIHVDPAVAGKEALKKAVDTIADKMIATVLDEWRQEAGSGVPIRLTVDNVKLPDELAGLTSQLMSISGVRHVSEMSIGGGEAAFDVDFKGDARGLATSLLGSKALTALFDITETTRNSVRLKAK